MKPLFPSLFFYAWSVMGLTLSNSKSSYCLYPWIYLGNCIFLYMHCIDQTVLLCILSMLGFCQILNCINSYIKLWHWSFHFWINLEFIATSIPSHLLEHVEKSTSIVLKHESKDKIPKGKRLHWSTIAFKYFCQARVLVHLQSQSPRSKLKKRTRADIINQLHPPPTTTF